MKVCFLCGEDVTHDAACAARGFALEPQPETDASLYLGWISPATDTQGDTQ
jgi:hypothetical protein